jgi:hypothetical protein
MERKMMNTETRFVKTRVALVGVAVALATALLLLVGLANPAPAASTLVNGDFETGNTTGWTASDPGNTQVVPAHGSYQPVDGNYFALLSSGNFNTTPVKLSQSFFADPGMTVSGDTFFQTTDGLPFPDSGQVVVKLKENGALVDTLFQKSVSDVGNFGQTPWTHWEHTFVEAGEYTIETSVVNGLDSVVPSFVGLDAVELSTNTIDTTPPQLNLPADITQEATGPDGAVVSWQDPTATDENPANPQVSCSRNSGDTFPIGTTTVNCSATDAAGNTANGSFDVTVTYAFGGFFSPVDNQPTYNEAKAGSAIPVKFSLSGDQGLEIFEAGYPKSEHTKCNSMAQRDGIEETATAGSSSLSYDATTDQYTYVWKTEKAWSDSCRQLVILLDDGTFHRANFNFVK